MRFLLAHKEVYQTCHFSFPFSLSLSLSLPLSPSLQEDLGIPLSLLLFSHNIPHLLPPPLSVFLYLSLSLRIEENIWWFMNQCVCVSVLYMCACTHTHTHTHTHTRAHTHTRSHTENAEA